MADFTHSVEHPGGVTREDIESLLASNQMPLQATLVDRDGDTIDYVALTWDTDA